MSVCKDVCRNPGGIIKLQERLLNDGSDQKEDIVLRTHFHASRIKNQKILQAFHTDARDRNYSEKFR